MRLLFVALLLLGGCVSHGPTGSPLVARTHADFRHDTFALTWQPGFCSTGSGCLSDQPHRPQIGLHGLWASEPYSLEARGVPVQEWWAKGCDLYDRDDTSPGLLSGTTESLQEVMPHLARPLYIHEFTKHARCFGYDPDRYFATAVEMHDRFVASGFGQWLLRQTGTEVGRDDMLATFAALTNVREDRALQLRCEPDHTGRIVLTQLWFTLDPKMLKRFPANGAYLSSPNDQNGCPATVFVPGWPSEAGAQRP